jgi:hypothetical protein
VERRAWGLGDVLHALENRYITLAQTLPADLLIIDERLGRQIACDRELAIIGTLGILDDAASQLDFGQITCSYEQYLNGFAPFQAVPDSAYRITLRFDVNGILAKLPSYSSNGHPAISQLWREACSVSVCEFRHSGGIGGHHTKFVQSPKNPKKG